MSSECVCIKGGLQVLAVIYGAITRVRNALYDAGVFRSYKSKLPVISIGNVTAGGNGKTPLCLYLVQELAARGRRPVILSRGYGGRIKGPYRVFPSDKAKDVGDEPLLMAQQCGFPVVVSRSRARGAKLIEEQDLGDLIILDDGFQHRGLARNLDIVSIFGGNKEAEDAFFAGKLLPLGMFREDRDLALKRASLVVVSYRSVLSPGEELAPISEKIRAVIPAGVTMFRASYEFVEVSSLETNLNVEPAPVHAVAGIANPEGFFNSLERVGFTVLKRHTFPDHHPFSEGEIERILDANPGVVMVCTEKDAVKIRVMSPRIVASFAQCRVRLKVTPSDAFVVAVMRTIPPVTIN